MCWLAKANTFLLYLVRQRGHAQGLAAAAVAVRRGHASCGVQAHSFWLTNRLLMSG